MWIDKNISTATKIINEEFKIKDKKLLNRELKKLYQNRNWRKRIRELLKSKIKRHAFLKNNLDWKYEEIKTKEYDSIDNIISNIKWLDINKLNEEELYSLKKIYNSRTNIDIKELKTFLGFLNPKDRNAILKDLNPTLNLKDLIELWVITEIQALNKIEKELKSNYKKLKKSDIKKIFDEWIDFDNIYITIDELDKKEQIKFFESDEAIKNLADELNHARNEVEKKENLYLDNDLLSLDDDGNIHNNFIDFIKQNYWKNIPTETINSIKNFKPWSFIKLQDSKTWKTLYYYIDQVDLGGTKAWKHIVIKNLTSDLWLKRARYASPENLTYEDLYKIIINPESWTLEFLDHSEYEKNTEWEKRAPDENNLWRESQLREILYKEWFIEQSAKDTPIDKLKFKDKEKGIEFYRRIHSFNDDKNYLEFEWSGQKMSYTDFLAEFRRQKKLKLEKKIDNIEDILSNSEPFKSKHIILNDKKDKLVYEWDEGNPNAKAIKTFIWENWNTITINKISENGIDFTTWKTDRKPIEKKKKVKVPDKDNKWKFKEKEVVVSKTYKVENKYKFDWFDDFLLQLNNDDFRPLEKDEWTQEDKEWEKLEQKSSLFGKWFTLASIAEVIQWGQMMTEAIKWYFERWNDLRAAKFAKMFWKYLPEDVKAKLEFNVTEKKKETIDKIFKELTEADSWPAMKRIEERILGNSSALPEEVYAAMKFMLKKRWTLYAKELLSRRNNFIWYQKLWGKKGDAFYMKYKRKIEEQNNENNAAGKPDPVPFTEEWLIEEYLAEYQKNTNALYPRVEKDYKKDLYEWQTNRFKKWEEEWADAYTIVERLDYFKKQLSVWEYSRAQWALTKILSKNSNYTSLYYPGFLITMSWVNSNFNWTELSRLVWTAYESPSTAFLFSLSPDWVKTYQNALIKFYENTNRKDEARKLKWLLNKWTKDKILWLDEFWIKNNKEIMDFFNLKDWYVMNNKWTKLDEEKFWWDLEKIFNTYKNAMSADEYVVKNEPPFLWEGKYNDTALADTANKLNMITTTSGWEYWWKEARFISRLYRNRLEEIKNMDLLPNGSKITLEEKRKLFKNIFDKFENKIEEKISLIKTRGNIKKSEIYKSLHNDWLLIQEIDKEEITDREQFLNIAFDYFMNYQKIDSPDDAANHIKNQVDYSLKSRVPSNNEEDNETVYEDKNSDMNDWKEQLQK